jgi:hypothetical protein
MTEVSKIDTNKIKYNPFMKSVILLIKSKEACGAVSSTSDLGVAVTELQGYRLSCSVMARGVGPLKAHQCVFWDLM